MPNKEVNNITLEIGDMIETYDLTDSNNPVIELKDTVTENANAGTEQHVFKETTADGHENQVSDFLIAQKQISSLRANSTGDGLVMESYDQKATHQQTDLRLAQVTTNKNNIATAQSDIRGLQTSIDNVDADLQSTKQNAARTFTTQIYFDRYITSALLTSRGNEFITMLTLPLNISQHFTHATITSLGGSAISLNFFSSFAHSDFKSIDAIINGNVLQVIATTDTAIFPLNQLLTLWLQGLTIALS